MTLNDILSESYISHTISFSLSEFMEFTYQNTCFKNKFLIFKKKIRIERHHSPKCSLYSWLKTLYLEYIIGIADDPYRCLLDASIALLDAKINPTWTRWIFVDATRSVEFSSFPFENVVLIFDSTYYDIYVISLQTKSPNKRSQTFWSITDYIVVTKHERVIARSNRKRNFRQEILVM